MKTVSRHAIFTVAVAVLLLGSRVLDAGPGDLDADNTSLPKQTSTHFFEVYHCGELAGVVWVTPGEAALYRLENLHSPRLRKAALAVRAKAREQGKAFAVHGTKGGCSDA